MIGWVRSLRERLRSFRQGCPTVQYEALRAFFVDGPATSEQAIFAQDSGPG